MNTFKTTTLFILFTFICVSTNAEVFFSLSSETQSFYLKPAHSSNLFGRIELQSKGEIELFPALSFKLDASADSVFADKQDKNRGIHFNPKQIGFFISNSKID